tara:strand:- start:333 stop:614 length:282 start_codon:yes stop_codon:yes gene_type:complete
VLLRTAAGKKAAGKTVGELSTIFPRVVIFVYYKSMKFTDDFQINLTSQQHSLLCDMCSFAATADFEVHHDSKTFNQVWDLVLNASHNIITEDS